ncbi:hypothetical protein [Pedobacter panaciterrae]
MIKRFLVVISLLIATNVKAQNTGTITVGGDVNKFYPVLWIDGGWNNHAASELQLGRSAIHENDDWRGSLIAKFEYHVTSWGNGAAFINADIKQVNNGFSQNVNFIAGWRDATGVNISGSIIIWLKGGGTTYHYKSAYPVSYAIYDGVANPLPYQEVGGPAHSYKKVPDQYVNSNGLSRSGTAFFDAPGLNYFNGDVSIGTIDPKGYKLAIAGSMIAESVKVKLTATWPDYVFAKDYPLPSLQETEKHIQDKGHLPDIPSAEEVKVNGVDLGDMNAKLLKKIEELTLHLIEQNKRIEKLENQLNNKQSN